MKSFKLGRGIFYPYCKKAVRQKKKKKVYV